MFTNMLSVATLCLLITSTLALPFGFNWSNREAVWGAPGYERHHPYPWKPTWTVTSYPTAGPTGTDTAIYPTGTGPSPTGYYKRDLHQLEERHFAPSTPSGFPTAYPFPTGTASAGYPVYGPGSYDASDLSSYYRKFEGARKEVNHENHWGGWSSYSYSTSTAAPTATGSFPTAPVPTGSVVPTGY